MSSIGATGEEQKPEMTNNLNPLEGILSYVYSVTLSEERREAQEQRQKPRAARKLYRRFLFYKYFIALNAPLIVTEGKTDPIYLREAVKSQTKFQPLLGAKKGTEFHHAVRYFNYGGLAHELLDLGGGTGDLKSIPLDYLRNLKPAKGLHKAFAHVPMKHPVIIILDNDDGLAAVASTVKKNFNVSIELKTTSDFYHVTDNLYIIKTPENGRQNTCIEYLFPKVWLATKLNEKKFNAASKIDPSTEYSKEVFAKAVVKANADKIDFSGFDLLLDRICKVIQDHSKSLHVQ